MNKTEIAVRAAGGITRVAHELKVSKGAVNNWIDADRFPAERVEELCSLANGMIRREQVRPDLWGDK